MSAVVILIGALMAYFSYGIAERQAAFRRKKSPLSTAIVMFVIVGFGGAAAIRGWANAAGRPVVRTVLGTVFIVLLSSGLFFLKVKNLRTYACLEIVFAATVAAQTMYGLRDEIDGLQALGLLTASYLLIRGLDNFKKDLDERRAKPS